MTSTSSGCGSSSTGRAEDGITHVAFGDLFLEDIRDYRIRQLAGTGIEPMFPLWCSAQDTPGLARRLLDGGVRAVLTCVDPRQLRTESFVGRAYDEAFLADLPPGVDPCGERGEFHTFCTAGPMFAAEIAVEVGERRHPGRLLLRRPPAREPAGGERFLTRGS